MNTKYIRTLALLPTLAVLLSIPVRSHAAPEGTAAVESNLAEARGDATKAALKELDAEIDHVDALIDNAPTAEDKAAAKARMAVLKERRSELRKTYVSARYDELKADVRAEANRVGAWTKRTFTKDPAEKAADDAKDAVRDAKHAAKDASDSTYAAANTTGAALDIAAYKLRPTDTNKEEAKAALKAIDKKIDELDDRADKMPKGPDRDVVKGRIKALESRKDELKHQFNKARFDALVDDVQSEWNDFRN
jgi:chromosome segregation ATPase